MLIMTILGVVGCDPRAGISYQNDTGQKIAVSVNRSFSFMMEPGETGQSGIIRFSGTKVIEAWDTNGKLIFSVTVTSEELEQQERTIVFTDSPPTEDR